MRRGLTNILVTLAVVTSLAAAPQPSNRSELSGGKSAPNTKNAKDAKTNSTRVPKPYQVGRASWYGKFFHGKLTASGEPYDMFLFTAAHRDLPLGTRIKVTHLKSGRSVIVRVNDRGPVPETRVIDLSYGAAQMLGFRRNGIGRVRIDILELPTMTAEARPVQ